MSHNLVFIHHGENVWNRKNLFTGWTDIDLSEKGVRKATIGGQLLKTQASLLTRALLLI